MKTAITELWKQSVINHTKGIEYCKDAIASKDTPEWARKEFVQVLALTEDELKKAKAQVIICEKLDKV